jgi:hypothetical protein
MRGPWNRFSRSALVECVEEIADPIKSLAILKEGLFLEATDYLANRNLYYRKFVEDACFGSLGKALRLSATDKQH